MQKFYYQNVCTHRMLIGQPDDHICTLNNLDALCINLLYSPKNLVPPKLVKREVIYNETKYKLYISRGYMFTLQGVRQGYAHQSVIACNQNSVQAISNRSRSKNDDIVVIGSFFNTRLSFQFLTNKFLVSRQQKQV